MKLFNRIINTEIIFEKCIGLAIGYTSYKRSSGVKMTIYSLVIPFMVIEIGIRYNPKNKLIPKKNQLSFLAKTILWVTCLCGLASINAIYLALDASTGADASALIMVSSLFTAMFVVIGICYLNLDPNEKYKNV